MMSIAEVHSFVLAGELLTYSGSLHAYTLKHLHGCTREAEIKLPFPHVKLNHEDYLETAHNVNALFRYSLTMRVFVASNMLHGG
jgi:hypothetical protein